MKVIKYLKNGYEEAIKELNELKLKMKEIMIEKDVGTHSYEPKKKLALYETFLLVAIPLSCDPNPWLKML